MPDDQHAQAQGRSPTSRLVIAALVVALILTFAFQNTKPATVHFLVFEWSSGLIYIIIGFALLGGVADRLLVRRGRRRDQRRAR